MNVLSIDVGLKNLAFCLFHIRSQDCYSIEKWGILNLCGEPKKCRGKTSKGIECGRLARFTKDEHHYCKIHAKKTTYKIPPQDFKEKIIKRKKLQDLKIMCKQFGISFDKKIKKDACFSLIKKYIHENYFDFVNPVKSTDLCLTLMGRAMKQQFDILLKDISIDCVIVENQVSPLANRMRIFQGMIIQHFIEQGIQKIQNISAKNKLKDFLGDSKKKTSYNERKKLSIQFSTEVICKSSSFSKWDQFFLAHKKKDDLADSFLQGLWFLKTNNLIIMKNNK